MKGCIITKTWDNIVLRSLMVEPPPKFARKYPAVVVLLMFSSVTLVMSVAAISLNRQAPRWDGVYYYAIVRSVYFDRDIDFANEAEQFTWMQRFISDQPANQRVANPFALGSAVLWLPFYQAGDLYCSLQPGCTREGYQPPYVTAILVGTVFWVCLGCMLNALAYHRLLRKTSAGLAVLTVISLALSSGLVFYTLMQGDYSHGNSYFAASLLLWFTIWQMEQEALTIRHAFLLGLAIGFVFLVRWQDLVLGILPLGMLVEQEARRSPHTARMEILKNGLAVGVGILVMAAPQMVFWKVIYGRFITVPQVSFLPEFITTQNLASEHMLEYFFSTWNGAFLWHPILLIATAGLLIYPSGFFPAWGKKSRALRGLILVVSGLAFFTGLMVIDWWAGGSFGQRRLISIYPFLGIGLLHIYRLAGSWRGWARGSLVGLVALLIAWNCLTMLRHHQGRLPFNPSDPNWYASQQTYEHFDYARRFSDVLLGRQP